MNSAETQQIDPVILLQRPKESRSADSPSLWILLVQIIKMWTRKTWYIKSESVGSNIRIINGYIELQSMFEIAILLASLTKIVQHFYYVHKNGKRGQHQQTAL